MYERDRREGDRKKDERKRGRGCGISHDSFNFYDQIRREVNCPAECQNKMYVRGGDNKKCVCTVSVYVRAAQDGTYL